MPNSKAAAKALRQSEKRRLHNRALRSSLRKDLKKVRIAVDAGDQEAAKTAFVQAQKHLDQSAAKHLIHRNKAARLKSRLVSLMKKKFTEQPASTAS